MIGRLELTRWNETSYNGVAVRALKSGLQKYARRGMVDKGLWCLVELDLFQPLESDDGAVAAYLRQRQGEATAEREDARRRVMQRARALRTNLVNRLIVITSEDVGIACWWLPLAVDALHQRWQAERGAPASRKPLVDLYATVAAQRKLRLISDLKSLYLLPPDYVPFSERETLRRLHADLLRTLGLDELLAEQDVVDEQLVDSCGPELRAALTEHAPEIRRIVEGLLFNMKYGRDHACYWLNLLLERQRDASGGLRLGTKADLCNLVWRVLQNFAERREALWGSVPQPYTAGFARLREVILVLQRWYERMTHRERPIYLYHALLLVGRRAQIDWNAEVRVADTPWDEVEARYRANLSVRVEELDPYVFDVHTGRNDEHALAQFADEGAFVENEAIELRSDDYRRIYHGLKERLDRLREGASALPAAGEPHPPVPSPSLRRGGVGGRA
jgi:hypothetical protein